MTIKLHTSLLAATIASSLLTGCGSSTSSTKAEGNTSPEVATACEGQATWPARALTEADAAKADPTQFIPEAQLKSWGYELDAVGLRATGNPAHEAYIDRLAARLRCAGVTDVRFEEVPITSWTADRWTLNIPSGPMAGPVKVAAYGPFTGTTPAQGLSAPMIYLTKDDTIDPAVVKGKMVVIESPTSTLPVAGFSIYAMGLYQIIGDNLLKMYSRPYLAQGDLITQLDALDKAGAAGMIAVSPVPYEVAYGSYYPYDGILRRVPMLFVDKDVGARLKTVADGTTPITMTLLATVKPTTTRNIIATIPGMSDEYTVIHSHTDGTNSIEDNGPDAIIGIAQYLARLPRTALKRSIMINLTAGHFTGGSGAQSFLARHGNDGLLDKIASIVTIEHLGAQEWEPDSTGQLKYTGKPELGAMFQPPIQALADASYDYFVNANAGPGAVLKPLNASGDGSPNNAVWPGEGQYFYGIKKIPTANYISGPNYLLNWGITTADKTDFDRMRRQMISFAQMQLNLSGVAKADLKKESPLVLTVGTDPAKGIPNGVLGLPSL